MKNLVAGLSLFSLVAIAGNSSGGGGDNISWEDSVAWFQGEDRTIVGCAEISPSFGVPVATAISTIEQAFEVWAQYLKEKSIYEQYAAPIRFAKKFRLLASCNGTEDVKFYLGTTNTTVEAAKAKYFNPTAFVERTSYDKKAHWGKGFVWVTSSKTIDLTGTGQFVDFPDWARGEKLLVMMLHEVGHLYGTDHVSGTVMTPAINYLLSSSEGCYPKIDHARELYRCDWCAYDHAAMISIDDKPTGWKTWKALIGREPGDFAEIRLKRQEKSRVLTVELNDKLGTESFQMIETSNTAVDNDVRIFQHPTGLFKRNYSSITYGVTLAPEGQRVQLVLEYNMGQPLGSSPLVLVALDEGRRVELARFMSP